MSTSLPQDVNIIFDGSTLIKLPICCLAISTFSLHTCEYICEDEGLPKYVVKNGVIALTTSGNIGVVAL